MASSGNVGPFKTKEEFFEFVQSFNRNDWAENNGYAGSIGITPVFNVDLKELNKAKRNIEAELGSVRANLSLHLDKRELEELLKEDLRKMAEIQANAVDDSYKLSEEWKKLEESCKAINNELVEVNKLTQQANDLEIERITNANQINRLQREISKELDYQNKKYEGLLTSQEKMKHFLDNHVVNTDKFNSGLSEVKTGFNMIKASVEALLGPWSKLDQAAASYARNMGMSAAAMRDMRANVISSDRSNKIAERTGLSPEEQIKIMGAVSGDIGRQIGFSDRQHDILATGSFLFGEDSAKDYVTRLENFGISTEEAMNRATDLFKESSNAGIAFSKTSKIFLDNLRLAQNYTFKDGVKGLSDMAKRSAEIKMNIAEVSRFVDKTSTLEGSLQSAAGLSVLGGSFAMGANPLQMLYNGLQDFEGAERQMENMLKGLVTFNNDTKQLEMSAFNRQRLKAASQAIGVNYEEMQNMAFAMGREEIVNPILDRLGIDKDSDAYSTIKNRSYLNEKGEAMINVGGEKKAVSKLTAEDIKELEKSNFDDSQNLNDIALSTRGILDLVKGTEEGTKANLAYLAEISGIGDTAKDVVSFFNDNTAILARIQAGILTANILLGIIAAGHGAGRMLTSFGGRGSMSLGGGGVSGGGVSGGGGVGPLAGMTRGQRISHFNSEFATGKGMGYSTSYLNRDIGRNMIRNGGLTAAQARSTIRNATIQRGLNKVGGAVGLGAIGLVGGVGGAVLANGGEKDLMSGHGSRYDSGVSKMGWGRGLEYGLGGMGTGAMIGSLFGPLGTAIGAGIGLVGGSIYGGISGYSEGKDMKYRNIFQQRSGIRLQGSYSNNELETLADNPSGIDRNLRRKLKEGDNLSDEFISNYIRVWGTGSNMAHGGVVSGRGTGTSDSNLAWLSNREYVMPARATAKPNNRLILDSMRDGADLIPSFKDGGSLIKPNGNHMNVMKVSERGKTKSSVGSDQKLSIGEVKIAPINIGGTIKLDLGQYSKNVDAKELLNNAMFVKNLTDLIAKNLNRQVHFGYDKDTFYKKF